MGGFRELLVRQRAKKLVKESYRLEISRMLAGLRDWSGRIAS